MPRGVKADVAEPMESAEVLAEEWWKNEKWPKNMYIIYGKLEILPQNDTTTLDVHVFSRKTEKA